MTLTEQLDAQDAKKEQGNWVPACGGTELPFTSRSGIRMQYLYQASTGKHAYIDLGQDRIMTDEEAMVALGMGL